MKKLFVSIIALLMVVCVICGCGGSSSGGGISAQNKQDYQNTIEIKVGSYPYYDSLVGEEKELYLEILKERQEMLQKNWGHFTEA